MAFLAWVSHSAVGDPTPTPQVFRDEKIADYQKHVVIRQKVPLKKDEADLPISELTKLYPYKP